MASITLPTPGADAGVWGDQLNEAISTLNTQVDALPTVDDLANYAELVDPGTLIAAKIDMQDTPINVGLMSDSTGDDLHSSGNHFEWFYRGWQTILDGMAGYECSYWTSFYALDATSTPRMSYEKYRIVPIGAMNDQFTGSGELNGKAATTGQSWTTSGGTGKWTVTNGFAQPLTSTSVASLTFGTAQAGNGRRVSGMLQMDTTAPASAERSFLVELGADDNNKVSLKIAVSTGGIVFFVVSKVIAGVTTSNVIVKNPMVNLPTLAAPAGLTNTLIPFSLEIKPTQISAFVNSESGGASIVSGDFTALGGMTLLNMKAALQGTGTILVDRIGMGDLAATPKLVQVWNGSKAGSVLSDTIPDIATLFPTQLDVMFWASSHNYLADTPDVFLGKFTTAINAFNAYMPGVGTVIASENPEYTPATFAFRAAHNKRQPATRAFAAKNGYGYIPRAETFYAQADGGISLVGTDGIHPKAPDGMIRDGKTFSDWMKALSRIPLVP